MSEMLRKQIYITRRQQALLKSLSKQRGLSEAEIIRQAIDREATKAASRREMGSEEAWEKAYQFMVSLKDRSDQFFEPYHWDRDELYEERISHLQQRDKLPSKTQD
jgi:hypothetical protein